MKGNLTRNFVLVCVACIATTMRADDPSLVKDQANAVLELTDGDISMATVLASYGAVGEQNDPVLPSLLDGILDAVDPDVRGGDHFLIDDVDVAVTFNQENKVIAETLFVSGTLGSLVIVLEAIISPDGAMSVYYQTIDENQNVSEVRRPMRVYEPTIPGGQPYLAAMIGKCKCSDNTTTGCTTLMCDDGDTCPGVNGQSCGHYTRSVRVSGQSCC